MNKCYGFVYFFFVSVESRHSSCSKESIGFLVSVLKLSLIELTLRCYSNCFYSVKNGGEVTVRKRLCLAHSSDL